MSPTTIAPKELNQLLADNKIVELIDVRTPVEYQEIHIAAARNVPLDTIDPNNIMESRSGKSSEPLYVICRSGGRGGQACQKFLNAGFENLVNVEGGMLAWDEAGLEVVRGKKTISLERQVRIAAGSLVVLSAALAQVIHPYFIGLSAFVGLGLVFAGLTDTCGMGMLLAKMPWNQTSKNGSSCCSG